ncbi:MAG: type III-A CRISPR-associated RAMP protein Csm5 [Cyclobacteriaceae bacterium]|nr:type III-A CRISPR-associated RAMP protein Csm5 [Cyclobacteriaceae bacterium]
MNNATLQTLTPVHIGNGRTLQKHIDYIYFSNLHNAPVALLDLEKVFGILGNANLNAWIRAIENREDLMPLIRKQKTNIRPDDVAHRLIQVKDKPDSHSELYEHLTDALGRPYIPGSSIKGSMRTALFTNLLKKNKHLLGKNYELRIKNIEPKLFSTPEQFTGEEAHKNKLTSNQDIFRFLYAGDCFFEKSSTVLVRVETFSLKGGYWEKRHQLTQWTECIPAGKTAQCRLLFSEKTLHSPFKHKQVREQIKQAVGKYSDTIHQNKLLYIVNQHTLNLLQRELKFINDQNIQDFDKYTEKLEELIEKTNQCGSNECVLRLGKHSGFVFMTGGWQEELMDKDRYVELKRKVRDKTPENLVLPKTRRFTPEGYPVGFVKIQIHKP